MAASDCRGVSAESQLREETTLFLTWETKVRPVVPHFRYLIPPDFNPQFAQRWEIPVPLTAGETVVPSNCCHPDPAEG